MKKISKPKNISPSEQVTTPPKEGEMSLDIDARLARLLEYIESGQGAREAIKAGQLDEYLGALIVSGYTGNSKLSAREEGIEEEIEIPQEAKELRNDAPES